jgi:thiamine-phosphate pyrophosphorylase
MAANAHLIARRQRAALLCGIYAIVNESPRAVEIACSALVAGVRVVQYRAKNGIVAATLRELRARTRDRALLIVNDDAEAVRAFDCDGVHLGPGDAGFDDVAAVRAALPECVIGLSCGTIEEAAPQRTAGADYLGVGAVYATLSKGDAGEPIGIEGLRRIAAAATLPVAAIGGISAANAGEVRRSGAAMAAVISALSQAEDPGMAAAALLRAWGPIP